MQFHNTYDLDVLWRIDLAYEGQRDFGCEMRSPLNFLQAVTSGGLATPELRCVDETGIDVTGEDETRLRARPDSEGGDMPILYEQGMDTKTRIQLTPDLNGQWRPEETGFKSHLEVTIIESDPTDKATDTVQVAKLLDDEYEADRSIKLEPGTGEYRLLLHLAREPYGKKAGEV